VNIDAALDHGNDEKLWNSDQQDDHSEARLGVDVSSGVISELAADEELRSTSSRRERIVNSPRPALLIFTIYFRQPITRVSAA
jgi:hypothetical protein